MKLSDYLKGFLDKSSDANRRFTTQLEEEAIAVRNIIAETADEPSEIDLERTKRFLLDVEKWKADCLEELTGNAARNTERQIWQALRGAINAPSDTTALLSIMDLLIVS